jgi:GNAT superfamily N-acetyltransferase
MEAIAVESGKADICRLVLDDLPNWFGIPEANAAYVAASESLPMFACRHGKETIGFVSLKPHTPFAVEMYVLGVKRRFHRQGAGRVLVAAALQFARREGMRFLSAKTLAASHPDPHYAATRLFYEAVGFMPLEVFPALWDSANPCLLMVRPV